jgi:hypothetical protein
MRRPDDGWSTSETLVNFYQIHGATNQKTAILKGRMSLKELAMIWKATIVAYPNIGLHLLLVTKLGQ